MSLLVRNTLKSIGRSHLSTKMIAPTVFVSVSNTRGFAAPASATPAASPNRGNIMKDTRKRVAEYRLKKPTLEQRVGQSDLYSDATMESVNKATAGKYVQYDLKDIAENFHHILTNEGKATDNYWLIRNELTTIIHNVNKNGVSANIALDPKIAGRIENLHFVHGLGGTGKSMTMAQLTAYYKKNGWVVLSSNGTDVSRDLYGHIYLSTFPGREEIFEQNLKSRYLLEELCKNFTRQLKKINLTRDYPEFNWVESEDPRFNAPVTINGNIEEFLPFPKDTELMPRPAGPGKTLFDLATLGAWRCDISGYVYSQVCKALFEQVHVPVLVCFDEVNHFDQVSELFDPRDAKKRVPLQNTSIGKVYYDAILSPPVRGATVIATTTNMNALSNKTYQQICGHDYRMCSYTASELQGAIEHYSISKFLLSPLDIEILRRCELTTGGVPRDVYRFVCPQ